MFFIFIGQQDEEFFQFRIISHHLRFGIKSVGLLLTFHRIHEYFMVAHVLTKRYAHEIFTDFQIGHLSDLVKYDFIPV